MSGDDAGALLKPIEGALQASNPHPHVVIDSITASNVTMNATQQLVADVHLSGSATFALADVVPNDDADLTHPNADGFIEVAGERAAALQLTKAEETTSFLRPYACKFTFDQTVSGVPIAARSTPIAVIVKDPVLGASGDTICIYCIAVRSVYTTAWRASRES